MNEKEEIKEGSENVSIFKKYKTIILGLSAVIIIAGLAYTASTFGINGDNNAVAKVNGEIILKSELQKRIDQDKQVAVSQGIDVSDPKVQEKVESKILEEIIDGKLLIQAAKEAGVKIGEDEINTEVDSIKKQIGGEKEFSAKLSEFGITEDEFRENILNQLTIQKYLLDKLDVSSVTATEEEIKEAYKQASDVQKNLPPLTEVKGQVKDQVIKDKQQKLVDEAIKSLRSKAEIKIF